MALLNILNHPDRRLRIKAKPITQFTDQLEQLALDMLETMYHDQGVGLAGTQVNVHKRIIVADVSDQRDQPMVFINPQVKVLPDAVIKGYKEGCLSIPDYQEVVNRPDHIMVNYQDSKGEYHFMQATDLLSVCIQHECDHLEGKLFIDYLSLLKRQRISNKFKKKKVSVTA